LAWYAGRIVEGVREPVVAGIYYESDPERLKAQLDTLFSKAEGAGGGCKIVGILVPHAGYIYSGDVAAKAYTLLRSQRKAFSRKVSGRFSRAMLVSMRASAGRFMRRCRAASCCLTAASSSGSSSSLSRASEAR